MIVYIILLHIYFWIYGQGGQYHVYFGNIGNQYVITRSLKS